MMKPMPQYMIDAIARGYTWECGCGEIYKTQQAARGCRKCREYLSETDFDNRKETNLQEVR